MFSGLFAGRRCAFILFAGLRRARGPRLGGTTATTLESVLAGAGAETLYRS